MREKVLWMLCSLVVCCMTFVACSDDNDGPSQPKHKMRLVKLEEQENGYTSVLFQNAQWDADGRILQYEDGNGALVTYTYTGESITCKRNGSEINYLLQNGKVVSKNEGYGEDTFSYDGELLVKYSPRHDDPYTHTWKDGNMVKTIDSEGVYGYEYSDKPNYMGPFIHEFGSFSYFSGVDPLLAMGGYFGNMPKNLVKSNTYDGKPDFSFEYTFNEHGYPTKIRKERETLIFTWED